MVARVNFRADPRREFSQLDADVLLSFDEAAGVLGLSRHTLKAWRSQGEGPPVFLLGRAIRYRVGDLREWVAARRKAS